MRLQIKPCVAVAAALAISAALSFSQQTHPIRPGDPLPGLAAAETQRFGQGLEAFMQVLEPEQGLGPAFNGTSCAGCHNVPAVGGSGSLTVVRAGFRDEEGKFHQLAGSTLFQLSSTPDYRCQVRIPPEANV